MDDIVSNFNWKQVSGVLDRILIAGFTYLATKGYISSSEVSDYVALVIGISGAFYSFWANRPKALAMAVASIPNTTVVTTSALAAATPDLPNIVSSEQMKVVNK